ncbi:MAG: hypothetical protein V4710_20135 [Verrucomicrobiota bacterium]
MQWAEAPAFSFSVAQPSISTAAAPPKSLAALHSKSAVLVAQPSPAFSALSSGAAAEFRRLTTPHILMSAINIIWSWNSPKIKEVMRLPTCCYNMAQLLDVNQVDKIEKDRATSANRTFMRRIGLSAIRDLRRLIPATYFKSVSHYDPV